MMIADMAWVSSSNTRGSKASLSGSNQTLSLGLRAFGTPNVAPAPDETIEMIIVKNNAALDGFNQWTLNGVAFSMESMKPGTTLTRDAAIV